MTDDSGGGFALPDSYWVGQQLDWEADRAPVDLRVQLPFWIFTDDCTLTVDVDGHSFEVSVRNAYVEIHLGEFTDSRVSCAYIGPALLRPESELSEYLTEDTETAIAVRKCRTVLQIRSFVNADVLKAFDEGGRRRQEAESYLQAFCAGHIPVVRRVIQQYRLSTYDYHAFEVSPWDIPVWFVTDKSAGRSVVLYPERSWGYRPLMFTLGQEDGKEHSLIEKEAFQEAFALDPTPGEYELLDALNLMERGDYSGAVRRVSTAIEVVVADALMSALLQIHPAAEAHNRLAQTTMNFPKRIKEYEQLSGRTLSAIAHQELRRTRKMRNKIVHGGLRIGSAERGEAQRSVDTGRWTYNWFENRPQRAELRETLLAKRSIGRAFSLFEARITKDGVNIEKPAL